MSKTSGDVLAITSDDKKELRELIMDVKLCCDEGAWQSAANAGYDLARKLESIMSQLDECSHTSGYCSACLPFGGEG